MHVLVIGTLTGKDYQPHLASERQVVEGMMAEGLVQDAFLKADGTGPILILNGVDGAAEAEQRLATLPFLVEQLAEFEYVELLSMPPSMPSAEPTDG